MYRLLQLFTSTTEPRGGRIVQGVGSPGAPATKLLTGYISPPGDITILGLDTQGEVIGTTSAELVRTRSEGSRRTRPSGFCSGTATGRAREVGRLATDATGTVWLSIPRHAIFALTTTPTVTTP